MATAACGRNAAASLALDRDGGGGFRLWPLFSAAAWRRKFVDALTCGVSKRQRAEGCGGFKSPAPQRREREKPSLPPPRLAGAERGRRARSERLAELLRAESSESGSALVEPETRRKTAALEMFRGAVKGLQAHGGGEGGEQWHPKRNAAEEVRRLAKEDSEARRTLAMLGAIPSLVAMLDSGDVELQAASLYALLNLGVGNDMNKAAIVSAGTVHKMLRMIESHSTPPPVAEAIVANFLGLSALDANKPIIGSSGAIPFLVDTFRAANPSCAQARLDALRALFNLSISPANVPRLVDAGLVSDLLGAVGDMEISERALSVLSNVVSTAEGRRAVSRAAEAFQILIDVLSWSDSPGCQEKAAYILMVMAHKAYRDRAAMVDAGIESALLELTLLGTPLSQKRASRVLESLSMDKGKQVAAAGVGGAGASGTPAVSEPLFGAALGESVRDAEEYSGMSEERRAVKQLVQQSLHSNMRRIARRANLPQGFVPSDNFRALTASSTSKSLPF